jgi:hypothetical protein
MSRMIKTTGLFFAAMLFFLSISTENYGLLLTSQLQNSQSENSDSYFSKEKPDLLFLNRHEERLVYSVKNLPVPSLKNHSNDNYSNCLSPEVRILSINSGYLSYSETLYRNLTNHDIIFPFHYFW